MSSARSFGIVRAAGCCFVAAALPGWAAAAAFPPNLRFRSVSTSQVTVHFHQGLETLAREAAALATGIMDEHEARYGHRVRRVHVVLSDVEDSPNGSATPLPYPIVQIRAVAPDGSDELGNHDGWLRLVLTHELAHIVHLDQARGLPGFGRRVFGRAPFLVPNLVTPAWMIEGLATYEETEGTAFGRGRDTDARMVLRIAALDGELPKEDRPSWGLDRWPGGDARYLFGESFLRDLTQRFGDETLPRLARSHAARPLPYLDDITAHKVTGASFHIRWREWMERARWTFEDEAETLRARGLTPTRPLTRRGIRQNGPRYSPDGEWIAYTSRTLERFPAIRLMRADGSEERQLARRNGGSSLSWSPDGKSLVFDELEVHRSFSVHSDLRLLDLDSRRVRRLTRGLRAREPDVSPDGRRVAFVRQAAEGSELAIVGIDGTAIRVLTQSARGTQWSGPSWSPDGRSLAAARWSEGGWLDVVLVDSDTGTVTNVTEDRAKDVEPAWTPDGTHVVFRSDRDGVSNLYAWRLEDAVLFRLTNLLGGAFTPDVAPDGRTLAFASYGAQGYDVHLMDLDLSAAEPAAPFVDPHPPAQPLPAPIETADRPYRPLPAMLPRFWMPYLGSISNDEVIVGVATGGADPLLRHAYAFGLERSSAVDRLGLRGFYQYDRFHPTFQLSGEDTTEPQGSDEIRTRRFTLRASLPLRRRLRSTLSASLAWRRERETVPTDPTVEPFDLGGLEAGLSLSSARQFPYSVSPVEGWRLRLAYLKEARSLGSDVSLAKLTADARFYRRLFGEADALALRVGGGTTFGQPGFRRSFAVGGFPAGTLFDVVQTNHSVLRGYPDDGCLTARDCFTGRRFAHANVEYRVPLGHPQGGWRTFPLFVRHFHAAFFSDAAHAWTGEFRLRDVKTGAGMALGADVYVGHGLPLTAVLGIARGFAERGETRVYFRTRLAF